MSIPQYNPQSTQVVHDIELDLEEHIVTNTVFVTQYDKRIPLVAAHITKSSVPFNVTTVYTRAEVRAKKKDGSLLVSDLGVDSTGQVVYVPISENYTNLDGDIPTVIRFYGVVSESGTPTEGWVDTQRFIIRVRPATVLSSDTPSPTEYPSLEARVSTLEGKVGVLESTAVRLLYTAGQSPTAAEIRQFVIDKGYATASSWANVDVINSYNRDEWLYNATDDIWVNQGRGATVTDTYSATSHDGMSGIAVASAISAAITTAINGEY